MDKEAKKTTTSKTGRKKTPSAKKKVAVNKQGGNGTGKTTSAARSRKVAAKPGSRKSAQSQPHTELRQWIAEAAYYRSEKRDFAPGAEIDDWLAAEQQIMERLQH